MPLGAFKAALMGTAGVTTAADVVLLHDTDYSDASAAPITSGIDSTYGEYIFKFYNLNPATDGVTFNFNGSIDGGSNYNVTKTSTVFRHIQDEGGGDSKIQYLTGLDHQQGTGYQVLMEDIGNGADESGVGELHLFNPSSTTYAKQFYAHTHVYHSGNHAVGFVTGGYFNNTDNIDAVNFQMSSGNFDGTIKLWGVK